MLTGCTTEEFRPTFCLTNTGPFTDIKTGLFTDCYWFAQEYIPAPGGAWTFNMDDGRQGYDDANAGISYVWAVQTGDISAVPVPAAVWLFGTGLVGLIGLTRNNKRRCHNSQDTQ